MHEAAYEESGIDAKYVTFEPAVEDLDAAIGGADALGVRGLNVTIPFKQRVLDRGLVDPDPLADRIGAVNTVDFTGDRPTGHNTDAEGARRALVEQGGAGLEGGAAVVVGAGGAGRAVAFALADAGATVSVANRTVERAQELVGDLPTSADPSSHSLDALPELLADASVLVNATSVGMEDDVSPVPAGALHADLTVLDAVYRPIETRLLREAAAAGATTIDGAWMLLYQGAAAFERWTGEAAPIESMNAALRRRL
jgi:shikimate dehydrogenase